MEITDIRIREVDTTSKMRAVVSVTFDNEFVIHDIKIIEGSATEFIAMPSRKTPDGEFKDIAHPINASAREKLQTAILEKYHAHKVSIEE
jgi:stage V sporulation protein G